MGSLPWLHRWQPQRSPELLLQPTALRLDLLLIALNRLADLLGMSCLATCRAWRPLTRMLGPQLVVRSRGVGSGATTLACCRGTPTSSHRVVAPDLEPQLQRVSAGHPPHPTASWRRLCSYSSRTHPRGTRPIPPCRGTGFGATTPPRGGHLARPARPAAPCRARSGGLDPGGKTWMGVVDLVVVAALVKRAEAGVSAPPGCARFS